MSIKKLNDVLKKGTTKEITDFFKEHLLENKEIYIPNDDVWPYRGMRLFNALTDLFVFEREYAGIELTFQKYINFVNYKDFKEHVDIAVIKNLDCMNFRYLYAKEKYDMSNLSDYLKAMPGPQERKEYELFDISGYNMHFYYCGALYNILTAMAEKE